LSQTHGPQQAFLKRYPSTAASEQSSGPPTHHQHTVSTQSAGSQLHPPAGGRSAILNLPGSYLAVTDDVVLPLLLCFPAHLHGRETLKPLATAPDTSGCRPHVHQHDKPFTDRPERMALISYDVSSLVTWHELNSSKARGCSTKGAHRVHGGQEVSSALRCKHVHRYVCRLMALLPGGANHTQRTWQPQHGIR
jgi:hypothetical protein